MKKATIIAAIATVAIALAIIIGAHKAGATQVQPPVWTQCFNFHSDPVSYLVNGVTWAPYGQITAKTAYQCVNCSGAGGVPATVPAIQDADATACLDTAGHMWIWSTCVSASCPPFVTQWVDVHTGFAYWQ